MVVVCSRLPYGVQLPLNETQEIITLLVLYTTKTIVSLTTLSPIGQPNREPSFFCNENTFLSTYMRYGHKKGPVILYQNLKFFLSYH